MCLPVDNTLPLLSNHHNQTPQTDATSYLNRLGEACITPWRFLALDLEPLNVRLNKLTKGLCWSSSQTSGNTPATPQEWHSLRPLPTSSCSTMLKASYDRDYRNSAMHWWRTSLEKDTSESPEYYKKLAESPTDLANTSFADAAQSCLLAPTTPPPKENLHSHFKPCLSTHSLTQTTWTWQNVSKKSLHLPMSTPSHQKGRWLEYP